MKVIRNYLILLLYIILFLVSVFIVQSANAQFAGGSYEGGSMLTSIPCTYTVSTISNKGGSYDGYSRVIQNNCTYTVSTISNKGGSYDGYSRLMQNNCTYTVSNVSKGGSCSGGFISVQTCPTQTWTATTCATPPALALPIELLYFTATLINNEKVLCEWKTVTEINNDYFTLEKTKDTKKFETIGTTKGAGNSTQTLYYAMTDYAPYQGTSYYRLKQTDYDGKYTYSDLVAVNLKGIDLISIYPNPSDDKFEYLVSTTENTKVSIAVIDVLGREIISSSEVIKTGINELRMDISGLSAGVYALQIITESGLYKVHKQFVKN